MYRRALLLIALVTIPALESRAADPQLRYEMTVTLVPEIAEIRVNGTVTSPPLSAPRSQVDLDLLSFMQNVHIESTPSGHFDAPATPPEPRNVTYKLVFDKPVVGQPITIRFSYDSRMTDAFVYHMGTDAMLAGGPTSAWYPQFGVKATGVIHFDYPSGYTLVAGGLPSQPRVGGSRQRTDVRYEVPSTFSFIASKYVVKERAGLVPMRAYVLRERPALDAYLDGCSRVLTVLSHEFGTYPFHEFALVEVPKTAHAKAGFTGASFESFIMASSDSLDERFNLAYFGHELGHQWWGNLVTRAGNDGGYLLSEGLAQYGSLRVVEEIEGVDAAERYRRRGYPAYNPLQSGLGYLKRAAAGGDAPLAAPSDHYDPLTHLLANSKGVLALDHVSRAIGRSAFQKALHDITSRFAFGRVSWRDFLQAVQKQSGAGLTDVFRQWFDRTGAPDWNVEWHQQGSTVAGAVTQKEPYSVTVDVGLTTDCGVVSRKLKLDGQRTIFAFDVTGNVTNVDLDPHFTILHWTPEYRVQAEALAPFTRIDDLRRLNKNDAAAAAFEAELAKPVDPGDVHGLRFSLEYGYARVLLAKEDRAAAKAHLLAALGAPSRPADSLPWLYERLAEIASEEHDAAGLAAWAAAVHAADSLNGEPTGAVDTVEALMRK